MSPLGAEQTESFQEISRKLKRTGRAVLEEWDEFWHSDVKNVRVPEEKINCREGCTDCCFARRFCTFCEGMAIIDFMEKNFSAEKQENFRLKVESAHSSIQKMRRRGVCQGDDTFYRSGGLECPFLEDQKCVIYPVRPLICRCQYATLPTDTDQCRQSSVCLQCSEVQKKIETLNQKLCEEDQALERFSWFHAVKEPLMIPEVLNLLWKKGAPTTFHKLTPKSWELRFASHKTSRDETWQDDRSDFKVLTFPLCLPEEGDYPPDFTLIRQHHAKLELYTKWVSSDLMPQFYSLYKRKSGCVFNWSTRQFQSAESVATNLPYTMWMSDDPQERLMMWEAAKRSSGKVLCGGLGLGVFPQLALSLPGVQSVHVVEMEQSVINMIQTGWSKTPWNRMTHCTIVHQKIEDYLKTTKEKYDTVYIDTWDSIYHEYLPHLNYLTKLCKKVLRPGGEILLWAFDRMLQAFLQTARDLYTRRQNYLAVSPQKLENIQKQYPLLHKLVLWLREHPESTLEDLQTQAYKLATRQRSDLGILKLSNQQGGESLVAEKYS